jgi:hypothetical protein
VSGYKLIRVHAGFNIAYTYKEQKVRTVKCSVHRRAHKHISVVAEHGEILFVCVHVQPHPEKEPSDTLNPSEFFWFYDRGSRTEGNKNIKGVRLVTTRGGGESKGIYEDPPNWQQSFLREVRRKRHPL